MKQEDVKLRPHSKKISSSPGGILAILFRDVEQYLRMDNIDSREICILRSIGNTSGLDPNAVSTKKGNLRKDFLSDTLTIRTFLKLMSVLGVKKFSMGVAVFDSDYGDGERSEVEVNSLDDQDCLLRLIKIISSKTRIISEPKAGITSIKKFTRWMAKNGLKRFDMYIKIYSPNKTRSFEEIGIVVYI